MTEKLEFHLPDLGHVPTPGTEAGSGKTRPTQTTWTEHRHGVVSQGKYIPKRHEGFLTGKSNAVTTKMHFLDYHLTLKRLSMCKPHNSAVVGTVMLPEYRNTRKF